MFGTFPKAFSQVATSQGCNFPSGNFPKVRLGVAGCNAARMGYGSSGAARKGWGPSATARVDFGSCRLGNCTFGKLSLGKIPLGSCNLGKILFNIFKTCLSFHYCKNGTLSGRTGHL